MKQFNNRRGFTLIELLIVIAVLGILVTGILVVLNPVEQTRRANDSSRASAISQLATAITAYSTSQLLQDYAPLAVAGWQQVLLDAGEIKNRITVPLPAGTNCTSRPDGNVCSCTSTKPTSTPFTCSLTASTHRDILIWALLDSKAEATRGNCSSSQVAIVAYDSTQQKTGVGCVASGATTIPDFNIPLK